MIYKFTYFYNNHVCYETFISETRATAKFLWLTNKRIPFKIITIKKRAFYV